MVEVVGDSTRDGRWALVRLALDGEGILSAEAEGLDRPLAGLTLLEAAAVGGDELAVDALANALAQVFRAELRRAVVEPFVRGYAAGRTPNPCIRCNGSFRFAELLAFAGRAGAERLATGHYARIVERDGRLLLARAADERKDQSYMLARLDLRFLERLWFPLGEQGKEETRAEAARAGLEAASRAES